MRLLPKFPHKRSTKILLIVFCISIIVPFLFVIQDVLAGEVPFWYDPARDFIQALENRTNPTLIGPSSGIPGVFYGPYWIWILSFWLLFTSDPRFVVLMVATIPYLILFPIILSRFSKILGFSTVLIMWILFVTSYGWNYAIQLWNPHIAPFFVPLFLYLAATSDYKRLSKKLVIQLFSIGLLLGFIVNVHISFGIGLSIAFFLWFILYQYFCVIQNKNVHKKLIQRIKLFIIQLVAIIAGVGIMFTPFILFEIRNGFHQIKTTLATLTAKGSVVTVTGLTKAEIIAGFIERGTNLLHMSVVIGGIIVGFVFIMFIIFMIKRKLHLNEEEMKLFTLICASISTILGIYLTSKNPVWTYHFIGVEILFLFLIGVFVAKVPYLKFIIGIWLLVPIFFFSKNAFVSLSNNPLKSSSLVTKMLVVNTINKNAHNKPYEVFAYSPSIYTYDYSYLFNTVTNKHVPYRPEEIPVDSNVVYVILPNENKEKHQDFIQYRTPNTSYKTIQVITIPDGTKIIKREKSGQDSI